MNGVQMAADRDSDNPASHKSDSTDSAAQDDEVRDKKEDKN